MAIKPVLETHCRRCMSPTMDFKNDGTVSSWGCNCDLPKVNAQGERYPVDPPRPFRIDEVIIRVTEFEEGGDVGDHNLPPNSDYMGI